MYHYQTYRYGNILGTIFHFPKRGDGIPMHGHNIEDVHNIIMLKGRCEVYGINKEWCATVNQGDIYHFAPDQYPHEITALEDDCTSLHLCAHGDKFDHLKNYGACGTSGVEYGAITIPLSSDYNAPIII